MTERRRRFERAAPAEGLVLTARDREILLACYQHQWLIREQLQRISGIPGVTRINQRLRQLYDHGYLQRIRAGTVGGGLQPIYIAGERAAHWLAQEVERPEAEVREHLREDARASAILLPHDLQLNDVRLALTASIRSDRGLQLHCWLNTRECYDAYAPGRSLRPDAYLQLWQEDLLHAFYLEVDRGTTNLTRWREKVRRYLEYREQGCYTARFGLQRFRVLTAAQSAVRLEHLREATRSETDRSFWFARTDDLLGGAGLRAPVWWPVQVGVARALIEE